MKGDRATGVWWGEQWFAPTSAPAQPAADPALKPLAGVFTTGNPAERLTLLVRGKALHLEGAGELIRRPGGFWSPKKDVGGVTRLWFDKVVNGAPYQVSFCGAPFPRLS